MSAILRSLSMLASDTAATARYPTSRHVHRAVRRLLRRQIPRAATRNRNQLLFPKAPRERCPQILSDMLDQLDRRHARAAGDPRSSTTCSPSRGARQTRRIRLPVGGGPLHRLPPATCIEEGGVLPLAAQSTSALKIWRTRHGLPRQPLTRSPTTGERPVPPAVHEDRAGSTGADRPRPGAELEPPRASHHSTRLSGRKPSSSPPAANALTMTDACPKPLLR